MKPAGPKSEDLVIRFAQDGSAPPAAVPVEGGGWGDPGAVVDALLASGAGLKEAVPQCLDAGMDPLAMVEPLLVRLKADPLGCVQGLAAVAERLRGADLEAFLRTLAGRLHPLAVGLGLVDTDASRFSPERDASVRGALCLAERLGCDPALSRLVTETGAVEAWGGLETWPPGLLVLADDVLVRKGGLEALPDGLWIRGAAQFLDCPNLRSLGEGLTTGENLVIETCPFVALPRGLAVGRNVVIATCPGFDGGMPPGARIRGHLIRDGCALG
jgi:hypothetical protein